VLVGRPQLWALACAGESGVYDMLELLRDELDRAMGLCGLENVAAISKASPILTKTNLI
jgi:isopentenyl diphosphate isomerase/L-lactate dehydrogenase-like FMN-dependent dehydrogenase